MSFLLQIISGGPGLFIAVILWIVFHQMHRNISSIPWPPTCCLPLSQLKTFLYKLYTVISKGQLCNSPAGPSLLPAFHLSGTLPVAKSNRPDVYALLSGSAKKAGFLLGILMVLSFTQINAAIFTSTGNGDWSVAGTWSSTVTPGVGDDVVIASGTTVTIAGPVTCNNLTINGTLVISGTNTLTVTGNWVNNGNFNAGTDGIVEFAGIPNASISGTSITNFKELIVNKGTSQLPILDVNSSVTISTGGKLILYNGLLKINAGGSVICYNNYKIDIPNTAGIHIDGGSLTTGDFTIFNNGLFKITSGGVSISWTRCWK